MTSVMTSVITSRHDGHHDIKPLFLATQKVFALSASGNSNIPLPVEINLLCNTLWLGPTVQDTLVERLEVLCAFQT